MDIHLLLWDTPVSFGPVAQRGSAAGGTFGIQNAIGLYLQAGVPGQQGGPAPAFVLGLYPALG